METNKILIKDLVDFGLSEKEALVYVSLLELEVAPANEISKKAGINRSSTYVVLDSLKEKGLVGTTDKQGVQNFVASSPEVLLRSAKELAKKHSELKNKIEEVVPELKALHKDTRQRPKVRVFEGKEGLINGFEDSLKCREKVLRVASQLSNLEGILPRSFFVDYINRRIDRKIKMFGIHPSDFMSKMIIKMTGIKDFDKPIFIPSKKFLFSSDIAIYDDKVGFMSEQDGGTVIIIENKKISETMKKLFDLAYEGAEKYKI